ncbi:hypothetical protein BDP81DRAFT_475072 [Colletotrichum phormii]|uniref:Uncharacterized protein n=1 Tax=Colletotrichum phormii TaxID=359342 RepID=A0AAI9ZGP6_9PEZI|nr:uncharacterized protein BDP81DRAFT_475072 [Colletotrichum phormii]KAK1624131.1 hypothetical protein BDP81DRAFT_475072 [Colletotrichum phormii]
MKIAEYRTPKRAPHTSIPILVSSRHNHISLTAQCWVLQPPRLQESKQEDSQTFSITNCLHYSPRWHAGHWHIAGSTILCTRALDQPFALIQKTKTEPIPPNQYQIKLNHDVQLPRSLISRITSTQPLQRNLTPHAGLHSPKTAETNVAKTPDSATPDCHSVPPGAGLASGSARRNNTQNRHGKPPLAPTRSSLLCFPSLLDTRYPTSLQQLSTPHRAMRRIR